MTTHHPTPVHRWFDARYRDGVRATCEGLFPDGHDAPGCTDTDLVERTLTWVHGMGPTQRPLLRLLFIAVELGVIVLAPLGGRMSRRPPEVRLAIVEGWRESWIFPLRLLGDALRASLAMVYVSHPAVMAHVGEPVDGQTLVESPS